MITASSGSPTSSGRNREYCQIEKLFEPRPALPRPHGFQVLALPVKLERASGAWARVVALCPENQ